MWYSVGIGELCVVSALAVVAGILALLRFRAWRWALIGVVCGVVAAILSPADPISMILLGTVFFLFFAAGTRWRRKGVRTLC